MPYLSIQPFGSIGDREIFKFHIELPNRTYIDILNYGAIIHAWGCPDRYGVIEDVLLGCRDIEGYDLRHPYFGCVVGRVANRINNGKFSIDGDDFQVTQNLDNHHLHGGTVGFDKIIFEYQVIQNDDEVSILFMGFSPDGDQGYPGDVSIMILYSFQNDNSLTIRYKAETTKPTPINLTNHCYFNLSGKHQNVILDHQVSIRAPYVLAVDNDLIPTGEYIDVSDTSLDLREPRVISEVLETSDDFFIRQKGFDHCYVLQKDRDRALAAATCYEPISGRMLEVFTDKPTIQLYTGNWLDQVEGKFGKYVDYAGLCLESQIHPDAVNHLNFPSSIIRPGEVYSSMTKYLIKVV